MAVEQKASSAFWLVFFMPQDVLPHSLPESVVGICLFTDDPTIKQVVLGFIVTLALRTTWQYIYIYIYTRVPYVTVIIKKST